MLLTDFCVKMSSDVKLLTLYASRDKKFVVLNSVHVDRVDLKVSESALAFHLRYGMVW